MKILISNIEILNNTQIPNTKYQTAAKPNVWNIRTLEFGACLEFRVSDLGFERSGVSL